jgi:hypothetical protein
MQKEAEADHHHYRQLEHSQLALRLRDHQLPQAWHFCYCSSFQVGSRHVVAGIPGYNPVDILPRRIRAANSQDLEAGRQNHDFDRAASEGPIEYGP